MANKGTVFVSGCFDILHGGHIEFFLSAKALGDKLIVCVPTDDIFTRHKQRKPALSVEHRVELIRALRMVDHVVIGDDPEPGLNFATQFLIMRADILAVTEDDQYTEAKQALCQSLGAEYVKLPKTCAYDQISSSAISQYLKRPTHAPLRVDFAGGWLDVPKLSRPDTFIVNCAISPLVSLSSWPYRIGGGLGGSAAYKILVGSDSVSGELAAGVGWQDPAIINETGLCVWKSGPRPQLHFKTNGDFLAGTMGIVWTGKPHSTPDLVDKPRDYGWIMAAGIQAMNAVKTNNLRLLAKAVDYSYKAQMSEGMDPLPDIDGAIAKKYLGSGWGGYALYLFDAGCRPDSVIPVEPYLRDWSAPTA